MTIEPHHPTLLRKEKADMIGVGEDTLRRWARENIGPPFRRFGPRSYRYWKNDTDAVGQAIDGGQIPKLADA